MKKYHLQRIDVLSVARVYLIIGLALGLIFGIAVMLFWSAYEPVHLGSTLITSFILTCMFAGTGACIMGFLAWLYNLVASKLGGIEVYIAEERFSTPISDKKDDNILS